MKKAQEKSFFRRKGYLLLLGFIIVALGVTIALVVTLSNKPGNINTPPPPSGEIPKDPEDPGDPTGPGDPDPGDPGDPVDQIIVFGLPVNNANLGMYYCEDELVWSETLGYWFGHMGMDFLGAEGDECLAVYDGVVESITTSINDGTTITIRHNDSLVSIISSLSSDTAVTVGSVVKKGDLIGYISDSGYDEYKEGPHAHLEVYENGKRINPTKYLTVDEK